MFEVRIKQLNKDGEEILEFMRKQIREERTKQGISQRDLSQQVNRSMNFISKVENGEQEPHILDMLAISIILQKPISYFLPERYRDKDTIAMLKEFDKREKKIGEIIETLSAPIQ